MLLSRIRNPAGSTPEILLNPKDKFRMICENLRASDASAFCFSSAVAPQLPHERLFRQ